MPSPKRQEVLVHNAVRLADARAHSRGYLDAHITVECWNTDGAVIDASSSASPRQPWTSPRIEVSRVMQIQNVDLPA